MNKNTGYSFNGLSKEQFKFVCFFLCFFLAALGIQKLTGGFLADRGNHSDEAAHFVSSLVIADYIIDGAPGKPLEYAKDYYSHFPKVAIGHWPPFFEILQAFIFLIFGRTATVALFFQAIIAGLCGALPAFLLSKGDRFAEGLIAGGIVIFSPIFLPMIDAVMADNLLAVMITMTAVCWNKFYTQRNWRWSFLFALTSALAILTKGTALGLALLPLIYLGIKRDWKFLFNPKTILSAVIVGAVTLPWYAVTYQMAADGWVFTWGWRYSSLAVPFFIEGLGDAVGIPCVFAYLAGIVFCLIYQKPSELRPLPIDVTAFVAASLAMIIFSMVAPADLDRRYLIPVLPSMAIVAVYGLWNLASLIVKAQGSNLMGTRSFKLARIIATVVPILSILLVFKLPYAHSLGTVKIVQDILAADHVNPLVLVSGNVPAEGAFISSFAEADRSRKYYVIRAQKVLADTNWMDTIYNLKFNTALEIAEWIKNSKIGWVAIDFNTSQNNFPHTILLKSAIDSGLLGATLVATQGHHDGRFMLYSLPAVNEIPQKSDGIFSDLNPGHLGGYIK